MVNINMRVNYSESLQIKVVASIIRIYYLLDKAFAKG